MNIVVLLIGEHRVIQRAVAILEKIKSNPSQPLLLERLIDFFRTYADKRHHGKEEDIFFKALAAKPLSTELKKILSELLSEHKQARKLIGTLEKLKKRPPKEIQNCIEQIITLYTAHIDKENHHFFVPGYNLFNEAEKQALLKKCQDFDQSLSHKDYDKMLIKIEKMLKV